jgi:hypothetical protein
MVSGTGFISYKNERTRIFKKISPKNIGTLWIRDPRSGIRKKFIPDPGGKKAPDLGSGSATLIPSHQH